MGPLQGIRVVEIAGIGPGPMCAMLLSDLGADVIRVERREPSDLGLPKPARFDLTSRGRVSVALDLKNPSELKQLLALTERADVLIEGFRPGVAERLGFGPDVCLSLNPRLVFGRMTGWGQEGPLAAAAGHDLNYLAITGALHAIGRRGQPPTPPLNLVADYGGGALYLAMGMLSALLERGTSGRGQIVDAAIVDGAASLMTAFYGLQAAGMWVNERGENILDSGAYFYDVYECADGKWISVAAIEGRFHSELLHRLQIDATELPQQMDRSSWPFMRSLFAKRFRAQGRDEWCALLEGTDACVAPVLDMQEAPLHPHLRQRGTFVEIDGVVQPGPAPRFSRSVPDRPIPPGGPPLDVKQVLAAWDKSLRATSLHTTRS